jgi:hypothetical protein
MIKKQPPLCDDAFFVSHGYSELSLLLEGTVKHVGSIEIESFVTATIYICIVSVWETSCSFIDDTKLI